MSAEPRFDSSQKVSGFNKYNHYQFGTNTCQYCKSDRTRRDKVRDWEWLICEESVCGGKAFYPVEKST